ncbi:MAG: PSD1 domain-containing protein [Planctomycetaceae bacterium]|nr:PSD1 domain-containing protein [Planctomycetaceae bacterium]
MVQSGIGRRRVQTEFSFERGASRDIGARLDRGAIHDTGAPLDRGAIHDTGARLDRGASRDIGAPLDRGAIHDIGAPLDRGAIHDTGARLDRGAIHDTGAPLDRGAIHDIELIDMLRQNKFLVAIKLSYWPRVLFRTECKDMLVCLLAILLLSFSATLWADDDFEYFNSEIRPILQRHCFACHSHQSGTMEGGLALDWRSGWATGGDRGPTLVPNDVENSLLIRAVRHTDSDLQMPPEKISDEEIAKLEHWIRTGAADPRVTQPQTAGSSVSWWSLQPLARAEPPTPNSASREGSSNPIDAWINRELDARELTPQPRAERRTLIRRLWIDLLGLHPTMEEVAAFEQDLSPEAWENLVDECLSRPQYAERWARHWLDTVHYADSHGFEHDVFRPHAWPYRDYVINALDRDLPYADFVRAQLAADYFFPTDPRATAALGFLGAGPYDQSAAATAPMSFEYLDRDDLVTQVCGSFLSTTANCARCHAHKFDPISQQDYFALQAVFAGVLKGEIRYEADLDVARARQRWQQVIADLKSGDPQWLSSAEADEIYHQWKDAKPPRWVPLAYETYHSNGGAELSRLDDGSILSGGPNPEQDVFVITGTTELATVTALRLDVLPHEALPATGPGRAPNGNFHLNEILVQYFSPSATSPSTLTIATATADFNQEGWTIEHAIDGNSQSAWAIHPMVGQPHHGIFVLEQPLRVESNGKILVSLKQTHGGAHVIGRLALSVCEGDARQAVALTHESLAIEKLPPPERSPAQEQALRKEIVSKYAEQQLKWLPEPGRLYAAGKEVENERGRLLVAQPRAIHVLTRGDLDKPREVESPGALSMLTHAASRFEIDPKADEVWRRAALAEWIVHPENPLTWRSMANRIWYYHFGRGIAGNINDFGRMGETPSHPELLDWLACELRDTGSIKRMHRLICTSEAYQRSSSTSERLQEQDPDNRWLGRWSKRRLDAESFRDSVLVLSGRLDSKRGGPGVKYFRESPGPQVTPKLHYDDFDLNGPEANRRSIYRVVWRGIPDPLFEALDFPDLGLLSPQRHQSSSPLQTLTLLNHRLVLHHAQVWAERIQKPPTDEGERREAASGLLDETIQQAVQQAWLRTASETEVAALRTLAAEHGMAAVCRLLINSNEFLYVD